MLRVAGAGRQVAAGALRRRGRCRTRRAGREIAAVGDPAAGVESGGGTRSPSAPPDRRTDGRLSVPSLLALANLPPKWNGGG